VKSPLSKRILNIQIMGIDLKAIIPSTDKNNRRMGNISINWTAGMNDARCACEIKSKVSMAKATFNKKKNLFTSKPDFFFKGRNK